MLQLLADYAIGRMYNGIVWNKQIFRLEEQDDNSLKVYLHIQ